MRSGNCCANGGGQYSQSSGLESVCGQKAEEEPFTHHIPADANETFLCPPLHSEHHLRNNQLDFFSATGKKSSFKILWGGEPH